MPRLISPGKLWIVVCIAALGGSVFRMAQVTAPASQFTHRWGMANLPLNLAAYAIAIFLCLQIRSDYSAPSTMRVAWLLMTWSSAMAFLRYGFEWISSLAGWTHTRLTTVVSLRQIPIVLSLVLLTAGLLAMWSSFASIGLGLRWRNHDVLMLMV